MDLGRSRDSFDGRKRLPRLQAQRLRRLGVVVGPHGLALPRHHAHDRDRRRIWKAGASMIYALSAPTGILDDHELASIFTWYQPVHAGWISPLDRMVRKGTLPSPEASAARGYGTELYGPRTRATILLPYASVS